MKRTVRLKRECRRKLERKPHDSEVRASYKEARRKSQLALREAKAESRKKFGEYLENAWQTSKSIYWKVIKRLRSTKGVTSRSIV